MRNQHQFLVYHTDTVGNGVSRAFQHHWLAGKEHLTLIGLLDAVEHFHQCALSCTVFPQKGVYLAAAQGEIDVIAGLYDTVIALAQVNTLQNNGGLGGGLRVFGYHRILLSGSFPPLVDKDKQLCPFQWVVFCVNSLYASARRI